MEHAMKQVVTERAKRPMDMRFLATTMAKFADQRATAV
jgi:hypothetical protein